MTDEMEGTPTEREVYPITWTSRQVLKALVDSTPEPIRPRVQGECVIALGYIGEIEHDPSLIGDMYGDTPVNTVAGIITDYLTYAYGTFNH